MFNFFLDKREEDGEARVSLKQIFAQEDGQGFINYKHQNLTTARWKNQMQKLHVTQANFFYNLSLLSCSLWKKLVLVLFPISYTFIATKYMLNEDFYLSLHY